MAEHVTGRATIPEMAARVREVSELDDLLTAHLTAAFIAPTGSFVTTAPITGEVRVCVGRKPFTKGDDVWVDWPAWRLRWAAGTLDAAFGLVERTMAGANFMYGRGRTRAGEPPYGCQLLFGTDEVLGQGEHEDGPCAVVLAVLDALTNKRGGLVMPTPSPRGDAAALGENAQACEERARDYHREVDDGSVWDLLPEAEREPYRQSADRLFARWGDAVRASIAAWHETRAKRHDETAAEMPRGAARAYVEACAGEHRSHAAAIRALPTEPGPRGEGGAS